MAEPMVAVIGAGRGRAMETVLMPPVLQCMEWVQELDRHYGSELLLKMQLLDSIALDMDPTVLSQLLRLWSLQPNLKPFQLERLQSLVTAMKR